MKDLFEIFSKKENYLLMPYAIVRVFVIIAISNILLKFDTTKVVITNIYTFLKDYSFAIEGFDTNGPRIISFLSATIISLFIPLIEELYMGFLRLIDVRFGIGGSLMHKDERDSLEQYYNNMSKQSKEADINSQKIHMDILKNISRGFLLYSISSLSNVAVLIVALIINYIVVSRVEIRKYYLNNILKVQRNP